MKYVVAAAFVGTVYAANWALTTWGVVSIGFGLEAPAGVFFAGLGFILRDALHELAGRIGPGRIGACEIRSERRARAWVVGAILAGAALSYLVGADATIPGGHVPIAVASAAAFLLSEFADFGVYTPLRERSVPAAVGLSQVVGAAVDSALFLWLAFGSLALFAGQFVGKTLMVLPVLAAIVLYRRRSLLAAEQGAA